LTNRSPLELRDLIVTPLLLLIIYVVAYFIRPHVTNNVIYRYFMPALTVRIVGALAVGFIYQFYYDGGDTYNYHTHGSRQLWNIVIEEPGDLLQLLFDSQLNDALLYKYGSTIAFLTDPSAFAVVRVAFLFDLLTFSTYSSTAVLFAVFSFVGVWLMFKTFYDMYPHLHKGLAIATFFIPSVFFWGSGLLKDTLTLGCLGIALYQTYQIFIAGRLSLGKIALLLFSLYGLYTIKIYLLLTFLPAAIVWITMHNFSLIRSAVLRLMLAPFIIVTVALLAYYSVVIAGEGNAKYSLENIAMTAQITAYDIRYWTGRDAGSGYSLGALDGSLASMIRLAPEAINVTLFRPYLWEVKNGFMLLAALESLCILMATIYVGIYANRWLIKSLSQPPILFLVLFSVVFAFAVGVSTFNFGTLVRYKIPMMPFFWIALVAIHDYAKRARESARSMT
jgi:hypothetical protein